MRSFVRAIVFSLVMTACMVANAFAAKSYAVLPFTLNGPAAYKHLERAVPQMLTSRLFWAGNFENVASSALSGIASPADDAQALAALTQIGADYLVYGDVSVIGQESSIDLTVLGKDGTKWMRSANSPVSSMIGTLKNITEAINAEVFKRPVAAAPAEAASKKINKMNPGITHNEATANQEFFLNPQFRYAGTSADDSRLRSNALRLAASGMVVGDIDGNGKNEVVLLTKHDIIAYNFDGKQLKELGRYTFPRRYTLVAIRGLDFDRDGADEIVVSGFEEDLKGASSIVRFTGSGFEPVIKRAPYLLNVVQLPPDYMPVLVGQRMGIGAKMWKGGVYEMLPNGGELTRGRKVALPEKGNVFNVTWLPAGIEKGGDKVILTVPEKETLRVLTDRFGRLVETADRYSGASVGLPFDKSLEGMGRDTMLMTDTYYIPIPPVVTDLDDDGRYELMVNKPISVVAQFFDRYRFFPQGEIHSLFWDGVGLSLQWKTRRIKGSVVAFDVKDVNNDGITDLVVCLNTHPGALGAKNRKTIVVAYPLDLSKDAENTAVDKAFADE